MPYIEPILADDLQTYYRFGTQLGLTIDEMTRLEYQFPDKAKLIMKILLIWRDRSQSVTHKEISRALDICGYPILSIIMDNKFTISRDIEASAGTPSQQKYGGYVVITDSTSKPVNGT